MKTEGHRRPQKRRKRESLVEEDLSQDDEEESHIRIEENRIYFYAPVNQKTGLDLISKMKEAAVCAVAQSNFELKPSIYIFIHSYGGDAHVGLSLFDHIKAFNIKVITVADGFVASAASLILLGGHERVCMEHAHILIHQLRLDFWGKYEELLDEVKNSKNIMKAVKTLYEQNTKLQSEDLENLLRKELNLNSKKSLKYGLIDRIV